MPNSDASIVSVYIIGRDCDATLPQALDSVYAQTRPVDEVIYLDDGSSDTSVEVANRYSGRGLVVLRNPACQGIPAARNRAAFACRGDWIAVLDADDRWHEEKIASQLSYLRAHPDVGVIGTFARAIDTAGEPIGIIETPLEDAEIREAELVRNCFVHSSVIFRRDKFERVGGYSNLPAAQDYDLMLKLGEVTRLGNLAEPLTDYRIGFGSTSAKRHRIQRACALQARTDAYRRRKLRPSLKAGVAATAHRLFWILVLFDPYIHWGIHQIMFGDPGRGRNLLRRARSNGVRSWVVATVALLVPDFCYRAITRRSPSRRRHC